MDVKVLERNEREVKFLVEGINPQFANALRRIMISEVPVLAIESVDFYENSSALFDEVIAHRLGLIPLKFDPKAFVLPEECSCEGKGCASCQVILVLDKKGPCMVKASDLKCSDENVKPLYEEMPIIELFEGQRLKLEAVAVLGLGKNHAKWQAAKAFYRYYPKIETQPKKDMEKAVEICPKKALKIENGKLKVTIDCDLCNECTKVCKDLKISGDENKIIFTVESVCGLSAKQIVEQALNILKNKTKEFAKKIEKL
jgi:DNA-directed RNA polymerase subunit D